MGGMCKAPASIITKGDLTELIYSYVIRQGAKICIFSTAGGLIGYAPASIAKEDVVVLLQYSGLPVILRRDGDFWRFRGFAYVHGVVNVVDDPNGNSFEIFEDWLSRPELEYKEIVLI